MRIAVIGAGNVGRAVGSGWIAKGLSVTWGVRDPESDHGVAPCKTVAEAVTDADIVVLAVMFHSIEAALVECGDLNGKVLIDPTNPLTPDGDGLALSLGFETSSAEFIAARTNARVVKSLNQVGATVLADPNGYAVRPIQFVAGDDAEAKALVASLVEDLGFEVRDAGPLRAARLLEPLAMVWIDQAMRYGMPADRAWALVDRQ